MGPQVSDLLDSVRVDEWPGYCSRRLFTFLAYLHISWEEWMQRSHVFLLGHCRLVENSFPHSLCLVSAQNLFLSLISKVFMDHLFVWFDTVACIMCLVCLLGLLNRLIARAPNHVTSVKYLCPYCWWKSSPCRQSKLQGIERVMFCLQLVNFKCIFCSQPALPGIATLSGVRLHFY